MFVNVTDMPASTVWVDGDSEIVRGVFTVITELDDDTDLENESVTVSSTLKVPAFANVMEFPVIVTPDIELTVYAKVYGLVPPDVVFVNVTDMPASTVWVDGDSEIVRGVFTVITELDDDTDLENESVTVSSTLKVPAFANVMEFPVIVTPDIELTVYAKVYGLVPPDVVLVNVTDCPASTVCVVGEIEIVGSELTVITELTELATDPRLSVTVSNML